MGESVETSNCETENKQGVNYDDDKVKYEYFEASFLSFSLFCLMISIGISHNIIIVNRYNRIPNEQCVLTTFLDPKNDHSVLNSDDRVEFNQNINDNILHKNSRADDIWHILRDLRVKNHNKIIIGNLNINSISNKFDALKTIIPGNIDIFVVNETKIDASFETSQFCVEGFNEPYRLDRNRNGGGILI